MVPFFGRPEIRNAIDDANLFVTGKDVEPAELVLRWCYPGYSNPELATLASLGSTQAEVLDFIGSNPRFTQSAIVNKINKVKGQVSEIVSKLVKRNPIRKTDQVRIYVQYSL